MGLRDRLRRVEKGAEEKLLMIPQHAGTVARFPRAAGAEAFMNMMDRLGAGEDARPSTP